MSEFSANKILITLLSILLFAGLLMLLYFQLRNGLQQMPADGIYFWQKSFGYSEVVYLLFTILLMPLNWGLELLKWRSLMHNEEKIPPFTAIKAILAGLTFALFTPNRIGEYGGRVLFVKPEQRLRTVFETIKGSLAQWLAILTASFVVLCAIILNGTNEKAIILSYYLLSFCLPMFLLMLMLYFRMGTLAALFKGIRFLKKFADKYLKNENYHVDNLDLLKAYGWALLRYLVYTVQYIFIVYAFGIDHQVFATLSAIALIYLLQTGLPLPPAMGLLARGSIAVWIFSIFGNGNFQEQSTVLAATFSLWCINLLIPALFGSYFIASAGFKKKYIQ